MNPEPTTKLGERLRNALNERDLSQVNLAHMLGVSPTQVSDWIHGRYRPTKATRRLIADLLRVSEKWLTEGAGPIYKEGGGGEGRVVEAPEAYLDEKRLRLIRKIKELARDPRTKQFIIDALLQNVEAFEKFPKE